jgi:hypothetical protein
MRRSLFFAALAFTLACFPDTLGPVQTIDGQWSGIQNGFSMSLIVDQDGNAVTGYADIGSVAGYIEGEVTGTFDYPNVDLTIQVPNVVPITYKGTLSSTQAVISAKLNGGGFDNLQLDVRKR